MEKGVLANILSNFKSTPGGEKIDNGSAVTVHTLAIAAVHDEAWTASS